MELSWMFTAILGTIILYLIYWLKKTSKDYWERKGVPYYESMPVIGILKDIIFLRKGLGEIFNDIYWKYKGKRFVGFYQFNTPWIMIRDPELINQVLIKDFAYFEDRAHKVKNPGDLFSKSFGKLTGDDWRNVRHKLTPTFTASKMKVMFKAMKDCSDDLVDFLRKKAGQDWEARSLLTKYVLNVIGKIAFGLNIDTLNEKEEKSVEFYKYCSLFFKPSFSLLFKLMISMSAPILRDIFKLKLTDDGVEAFFSNLTNDIIKHRQETDEKRNDFLQLMLDLKKKEKEILNNGASTDFEENEPIESEDKELMDQLKNMPLKSKTSEKKEVFTDEFITAQTFIFISGGSETVSGVLSFVLFELAHHQDLQKKVQDEIDAVISSQELNYESTKKLLYMEQFIYETFRTHPIGPSLIRMCTKNYKIPGTEVIIETGNFVSIPLIGLQHDPQYFPEPQKFDPDRFEDMDAIPKGVFFPFGGGPRMCIAMRLAMLEMKVVLANLLANYTITLSEKTKLPLKMVKNSFLVSVEGGVWIKFNERK